MAFNQSTSTASNVAFVNYSATLGMLFLASKENLAALNECKAFIGPEDWKKGFTGMEDFESTTAKARKFMSDRGVRSGSVSGFITKIEAHEHKDGSQVNHYLRLSLNDLEGAATNVSLDMSNDGTQHLIRKLAVVHPGEFVDFSVFAMLSKPSASGKRYGNHYAKVDAGVHPGALQKVEGIDIRNELIPAQENAKNQCADAGLTDVKLVNAAKDNASLKYHLKLVAEMEARLLAHNADAQAAHEHA